VQAMFAKDAFSRWLALEVSTAPRRSMPADCSPEMVSSFGVTHGASLAYTRLRVCVRVTPAEGDRQYRELDHLSSGDSRG
jgi:hypothetical protein